MSKPRMAGLALIGLWAALFFVAPALPPETKDEGTRPARPWLGHVEQYAKVGVAQVGGNVSPCGTEEIHCDLYERFHLKNRGGSDKAGLCVFASLQHSSIWQNVHQTMTIFEFMFTRPGGGWPEKVDRMIAALCKEKGYEIPAYVQIESRDLEPLKIACRSGRMPGVTYNFSPTKRYGGQRIAHMVSLVHASDKWFAILDNNYPGADKIEWMDPQTFLSVYTGGRGNGWAAIFLDDGPPPPPRN